ncbi:unnamed protein product, partial [Iphiclides podalirius]
MNGQTWRRKVNSDLALAVHGGLEARGGRAGGVMGAGGRGGGGGRRREGGGGKGAVRTRARRKFPATRHPRPARDLTVAHISVSRCGRVCTGAEARGRVEVVAVCADAAARCPLSTPTRAPSTPAFIYEVAAIHAARIMDMEQWPSEVRR